nr:hypothetical protein CFP56_42281 [Quercus suber]
MSHSSCYDLVFPPSLPFQPSTKLEFATTTMLTAYPIRVVYLLAILIRLSWSISTPPAQNLAPQYNPEADDGTLGYYPVRNYASAPAITSPQTNFLQWDEQCEDGQLYMMTPRGESLPQPGPMILDARGELVWAGHFDSPFGGQAYNLMVQTYRGEEYLTFWLGDDRVRGHGSGYYHMVCASCPGIGGRSEH